MTDTPAEREDSSIWADLRRRRVVQWALAYAAGAWVLLQVLGFVSDSFVWPTTVKQIATILLAIGLPIVVVLGWYHGDRGHQRVTGPELGVLTLLLVLGGGLLWVYAQRSEQTTPTVAAAEPTLNAAADDARPIRGGAASGTSSTPTRGTVLHPPAAAPSVWGKDGHTPHSS